MGVVAAARDVCVLRGVQQLCAVVDELAGAAEGVQCDEYAFVPPDESAVVVSVVWLWVGGDVGVELSPLCVGRVLVDTGVVGMQPVLAGVVYV